MFKTIHIKKRFLVIGALLACSALGLVLFVRGIEPPGSEMMLPSTALVREGTLSPNPWAGAKHLLKVGFQSLEDLSQWTIHEFNGRPKFEIQLAEDGEFLLDLKSEKDATLFLKEVNLDISRRPKLSWEWSVKQFPSGKLNEKFAVKKESDFAARVYVVFKGTTNFTSDTIQYIWDDHFAPGTNRSIPFFKHLKMMIVRKTEGPSDKWFQETRDIYADYEMLFGKPPKKLLRAVGFMSDSDNTGTSAHAQFKNLTIHY